MANFFRRKAPSVDFSVHHAQGLDLCKLLSQQIRRAALGFIC